MVKALVFGTSPCHFPFDLLSADSIRRLSVRIVPQSTKFLLFATFLHRTVKLITTLALALSWGATCVWSNADRLLGVEISSSVRGWHIHTYKQGWLLHNSILQAEACP